MKEKKYKYIYGPVPSRRLGRSLGIDLVPFKTCTYNCIYCQLGRTTNLTVERKNYIPEEKILEELKRKLESEDIPDYISLAGSGEPTLNRGIGKLITEIKKITRIPVAVLTNGSLLWVKEIQENLIPSDLVIPSLDAGDEKMFKLVNRPHEKIEFQKMVNGIIDFTRLFSGEVWLEVLLLEDLTGKLVEVKKIAELVKRITPARVQLNSVCRPPAEAFATPLSTEKLLQFKALFSCHVDILSSNNIDNNEGKVSSEIETEIILALLSRRPCTAQDVAKGLGIHVTEAVKVLAGLLENGNIEVITSNNLKFYIKKNNNSIQSS